MTISNTGNVGIGTAPTAKLHVGGTPGVDGIRFPDGTLQTSAGITSESDPQVDAVTTDKWCRGTGTQVTCDQGSAAGGPPITCPVGFTNVVSGVSGIQLGCIQNALRSATVGTQTCTVAILDCWDTYGGRLPEYNEIYIALTRFNASLSSTPSPREWTGQGDVYGQPPTSIFGCGAIESGTLTPGAQAWNSPAAYRCFIPNN